MSDVLKKLVHDACVAAIENGYDDLVYGDPTITALDMLDYDADLSEGFYTVEQIAEIIAEWQKENPKK